MISEVKQCGMAAARWNMTLEMKNSLPHMGFAIPGTDCKIAQTTRRGKGLLINQLT